MQGNYIALGKYLLPARCFLYLAGKPPCRIHGKVGVKAQHLHAQIVGIVCHKAAYCSKAYNAQLFPAYFMAHKGFFALFHKLWNLTSHAV